MTKIKREISINLIVIFCIVLSLNTNFFKNLYDINHENHDQRQQKLNDFCEIFGTGYIYYIKKKFNLIKSPEIVNFTRSPSQHWIFNTNYKKIDKDKLIILNKPQNEEFNFSNYIILNNYRNRCFYMERK